jgi:DNA-binding NarL/FixJ family response regulator
LAAGPNAGKLFGVRPGHDGSTVRGGAQNSLRLASGTFANVLEERSPEWRLTSSERDVAVKGFSISEIAALCKSSEDTVKARTHALCRKARGAGRSQPMSVFIDEWLTGQIGKRL